MALFFIRFFLGLLCIFLGLLCFYLNKNFRGSVKLRKFLIGFFLHF